MAVELGTVAPIGFDDFAPPEWMQYMRELGCSSVQVYRNRNGNDANHFGPVTIGQVREYLASAELPCDSLHAFYGNDLDLSSPDENARLAAIDVMRNEGNLALELGGPLVVVHCSGIFPGSQGLGEQQTRRNQLARSINELGQFGQANSVQYAFENLPPYHAIGYDVADLAEMLRNAKNPFVGMCFDIAHANLAGDPIRAIGEAGDQIIYSHMCDNLGQADDHLMPFLGQIDWPSAALAIREIKYDGVLMLEAFYKVDELRKLIDEGIGEKISEFLAVARGEKI